MLPLLEIRPELPEEQPSPSPFRSISVTWRPRSCRKAATQVPTAPPPTTMAELLSGIAVPEMGLQPGRIHAVEPKLGQRPAGPPVVLPVDRARQRDGGVHHRGLDPQQTGDLAGGHDL